MAEDIRAQITQLKYPFNSHFRVQICKLRFKLYKHSSQIFIFNFFATQLLLNYFIKCMNKQHKQISSVSLNNCLFNHTYIEKHSTKRSYLHNFFIDQSNFFIA